MIAVTIDSIEKVVETILSNTSSIVSQSSWSLAAHLRLDYWGRTSDSIMIRLIFFNYYHLHGGISIAAHNDCSLSLRDMLITFNRADQSSPQWCLLTTMIPIVLDSRYHYGR